MLEPRRRRLPLTALDNVATSSQESNVGSAEKKRNGKVKKRRRRRAKSCSKFRRRGVQWTVLAAMLVTLLWRNRQEQSTSASWLRGGWFSITSTHEYRLEHRHFYDAVRHSATNATQDDVDVPFQEKHPFTLTSTYGTRITEQGCNLTVVFMDPRLATATSNEAAWFSLESVAAFCPDACVLLQTATCVVREHLEESQGFISDEAVSNAVADHIYDKSLPLFRSMIEDGRARVTFPNHEKYNLKSCSDYGNPSSALMNIRYWADEFIDGVDSDHVLFIQDDAVLCHSYQLENYKDLAFVGSVWSKTSFQLKEGMCNGMPLRWSSWVGPQKHWERQQLRLSSIPAKKLLPRPSVLINTTFPNVCSNGNGPVGNGGLSLRSRTWAIKAIETCPHVEFSDVDMDTRVHACKVYEDINEDLYFGIVLRGIGAPLPSAYQASLFSTEMLWPEQVEEMFGIAEGSVRISGQDLHQVRHDGKRITVPAAVHKPWWYHSSELLRSPEMDNACPFLQYIFPSEQSEKWKEWQRLVLSSEDKKQWQGIGA